VNRVNRPREAVMQPYVKLLQPLVIIISISTYTSNKAGWNSSL